MSVVIGDSEGFVRRSEGFPLNVIDQSTVKVDSADIWAGDCLDRKVFAEKLLPYISCQENPMTFSLDGEWGTGKTFFLKRFVTMYEKEGGKAIYFSAWEDDYFENAFLTIVGQLWKKLRIEYWKSWKGIFRGLWLAILAIVRLCGILFSLAFKVPFLGAAFLLQLTWLVGLIWFIVRFIVAFKFEYERSKNQVEVFFDHYLVHTAPLREFKAMLVYLANGIKKKTNKPLLIIVDELDRCRPTFAIEVLERVKHLFVVGNIVFLFGVNKRELCKSIHAVYGDIDANNYLHRFFDYNIQLEETEKCKAFFSERLFKEYQIEANIQSLFSPNENGKKVTFVHDNARMMAAFIFLSRVAPLSLREMQMVFRLIVGAVRRIVTIADLAHPLIVFMAVLRVKYPDRYVAFLRFDSTAAEMIDRVFCGHLPNMKNDAEKCAVKDLVSLIYNFYLKRSTNSRQTRFIKTLLNAVDKRDFSQMSFENIETKYAEYVAHCLRYCPELLKSEHQLMPTVDDDVSLLIAKIDRAMSLDD